MSISEKAKNIVKLLHPGGVKKKLIYGVQTQIQDLIKIKIAYTITILKKQSLFAWTYQDSDCQPLDHQAFYY